MTLTTPAPDVIEVVRAPARAAPAASTYRVFGETLRGLKTTFARDLRGAADDPVPGGEDAGLPALPRPPQAAPVRGHRPREVRRLLAVRRRLPGRLHPRRRRREHAGEPRLGRRALRRRLRDQPEPLHLLRLLRDRLPVRRDHDGPRLRDVRLHPLRPDLHQGDAARRADRAHAAADARASSRAQRSCSSSPRSARSAARSASSCSATRSTACSRSSVHLVSLAALFLLLRAEFVAAAQVSSTPAR